MPVYFLLLDADRFRQQISPALAASWRQRSFVPCRQLCESLLPAALVERERFQAGPEEPLLAQVVRGLPFDRNLWRLLVAEVLLVAAVEAPVLQTAPETLVHLLTTEAVPEGLPRDRWPPIHQAHFGSRDLVLGGYYRPDHAGLNDVADVRRLATYLTAVNTTAWSADALTGLIADPEDREDELALARECFAGLRDLY
jgi:hypothetical protein